MRYAKRITQFVDWTLTLGVISALLFVLFACVPKAEPSPVLSPANAPNWNNDTIAIHAVGLEPGTEAFLNDLRNRMFGHSRLPDLETVLCLYGIVKADTANVAFLRPANIDSATAVHVRYESCPRIKPGAMGAVRYLGTVHVHFPDSLPQGGCYFSHTDNQSFYDDKDAIIDLLACRDGVIVRGK